MLFDFNEAWTRAKGGAYDVCICGTGPAGITAARKLAAWGKKILLLEGGSLSYSDQSQNEYKGKSVGREYWGVDSYRLRYFGGTSNHWSGRCGLLQPIDFETRDYTGLPGWPISREEVLTNIDEAQEILDIAGKKLERVENPEFKSRLFLEDGWALSAPTRFAEKYGAEIRKSQQIDVFVNANLVDLRLNDDSNQIKSFQIQNYGNQKIDVSAQTYILALGAIENARLLLNANSQVPEGIGNHSGWVGRCFMEHLNVSIGRFVVTDPQFFKRGGVPLVPSESLMRQNNIGNGIVGFEPNATPKSYGRLAIVKQFLRETGCYWPAIANIARRAVDFDCPGDGIIDSMIEQTPNPQSRVTLTDDVDVFGLRRIQLNWQLNDRDLKTIRVLAIEAAKEMARLNRSRVQLAPYILDDSVDITDIGGHAHQMGTTRMSEDPRFGVVDGNCRVHGIRNLYIAGSSVYPTGGGINPTLTIVLLALKLANFVRTKN